MHSVAESLIAFLIVVSGLFGLVGSFGLLKLRDTMQRLHGPTKTTTLGVGGALISSMVYFLTTKGTVSFHELLIALFLFITAPITANFIAKCHIARNLRPEDLPPTGNDYGWSTYDDPPTLAEADGSATSE